MLICELKNRLAPNILYLLLFFYITLELFMACNLLSYQRVTDPKPTDTTNTHIYQKKEANFV